MIIQFDIDLRSPGSVVQEKTSRKINYVQFIVLCFTFATQNLLVTGAISVSMTSIQKSFNISSFYFGLCLTVYHLFFIITSIPLSYFGRYNKMRYVSLGMIIIVFGALIVISPVLSVFPKSTSNFNSSLLCTKSVKEIPKNHPMQIIDLFLMCFGYALIGIGSSPLYNIVFNQFYDFHNERMAPFLVATYLAFSTLGLLFTIIVSKFFLIIPLRLQNNPINSSKIGDEDWIGAYWLIYLYAAVAMFLFFIMNIIISHFNDDVLAEEIVNVNLYLDR